MLVQGLVVRPATPASYARSRDVLAVIQEALRRPVELDREYEPADSPLSRRIVAPRALAHAARGLHSIAHDTRAKAARTLRVERVRHACRGSVAAAVLRSVAIAYCHPRIGGRPASRLSG